MVYTKIFGAHNFELVSKYATQNNSTILGRNLVLEEENKVLFKTQAHMKS
jgi:hypothetical protein